MTSLIHTVANVCFSALQRAEIAEIMRIAKRATSGTGVSVLFNEPKLLKLAIEVFAYLLAALRFSALQRAEIAEIQIILLHNHSPSGFSALQRAEIAEISVVIFLSRMYLTVSVLFNEPKLLKFRSS